MQDRYSLLRNAPFDLTPSAGIIRFRFKGYFSAGMIRAPLSLIIIMAERNAAVHHLGVFS